MRIVSIYGQKAVSVGYKFQSGYCFRQITDNRRPIAQLEVVLDDNGIYKGLRNKWVDVTLFDGVSVEKAFNYLARLGFEGCYAFMSIEDNMGRATDTSAFFQIKGASL